MMDLFNTRKVKELERKNESLNSKIEEITKEHNEFRIEYAKLKRKYENVTKTCNDCGFYCNETTLNKDKTVNFKMKCTKADCEIKDTKPCKLFKKKSIGLNYLPRLFN